MLHQCNSFNILNFCVTLTIEQSFFSMPKQEGFSFFLQFLQKQTGDVKSFSSCAVEHDGNVQMNSSICAHMLLILNTSNTFQLSQELYI